MNGEEVELSSHTRHSRPLRGSQTDPASVGMGVEEDISLPSEFLYFDSFII